MFNFGPTNPGLADEMREWEQYHAENADNAHRRWQQREQRARYDEENRLQLADAESYRQMRAQQAGLFDNMDDTLSQLSRNRVTPATATRPNAAGNQGPASLQPGTTQAPASSAPTSQATGREPPTVDIHADMQTFEYRQYTREELRRNPTLARQIQDAADQGHAVIGNLVGGNIMVYPREGRAPGQEQIGPFTFPAHRPDDNTVVPAPFPIPAPMFIRPGGGYGFGIDPRMTAGRFGLRGLTQRQVDTDVTQNPIDDIAAYAENNVGLNPEEDTEESSGAGANGGTSTSTAGGSTQAPREGLDPYYQGNNDTSRGIEPTVEMRMLEAITQNALRRADLYASRGRNDAANEFYSNAVQNHLLYTQQGRVTLLRLAAQGNLAAAGELTGQLSGYPEGTVRFRPTDEEQSRLILEIDTGNGNWVAASEVPMHREEMLGSLMQVVDAEGARAQQEINAENHRTQQEIAARIVIATMEQETAARRILADAGIASMEEQGRNYRHNTDAEFVVDSETGMIYANYPNGDSYSISLEEQRVVDTNGERTEQRPVRRQVGGVRVSGTTGVGMQDE